MNNFDFCALIQNVVETTPIYRLKQSWEKVEKIFPRKREEFKQLVGPCAKSIGTLMNKSEPPFIPFIGTVMQWIVLGFEERISENGIFLYK